MSANDDIPMREGDVDMQDSSGDELIADDDDDDSEMSDTNNHEQHQQPPPPRQPEPPEEDVAMVRRRAIQDIMRDTTLSADEKRFRIQGVMSNNRLHVAAPAAPVVLISQANAACVHYERNCNIVAPCCNLVFGCRICHDELTPTEHPPMNRFLIREVVCKNCSTRQAASYVV
jgi:hypothetical protein